MKSGYLISSSRGAWHPNRPKAGVGLRAGDVTGADGKANALGYGGFNLGGQSESDEGTRVRVRDRKRGHAADQIRSDTGLDAKTQSQIRSDTGLFFYR